MCTAATAHYGDGSGAAWRAAQLSWPRPQVSALSHPSSGARGTHWLLQSAFWLLLLTAEAATRVLDRVSELEGFYIDANDGFRYEIARGFEIEEKIGLAQRKYSGYYVFHYCEPPLTSVFCDNYLPKCWVDSRLRGIYIERSPYFWHTLFYIFDKEEYVHQKFGLIFLQLYLDMYFVHP